MVDGKKRVESIPAEWIDSVRAAVDASRGFKDALTELFAINTQLLVLARQQRRRLSERRRSWRSGAHLTPNRPNRHYGPDWTISRRALSCWSAKWSRSIGRGC
jgi:hypothetical protein